MDWLATARTGRPQVKQFRHDVQQTIIAAIDLRPHMVFGTSGHPMIKTACLAAAALAWITSKDHQPFGLLLIGAGEPVLVPPRRGRRARLQHLSRLVEGYHAAIADRDKPSPPLADGLDRLTSAMAGDVEAVVISDFSAPGEAFDQRLGEAGARGSISAIIVEDRLAQQAPPAGGYPVRSGDDQTVAALAIHAGDENVYRVHAERCRRRLTARLLGLGARQALVADPSSMMEGYFR
jgi:uncharacterized protein (DUF58 family)